LLPGNELGAPRKMSIAFEVIIGQTLPRGYEDSQSTNLRRLIQNQEIETKLIGRTNNHETTQRCFPLISSKFDQID